MSYSEKDMKDTEDYIRCYFRRISEIDRLKHRLRALENEREKVANDINGDNIHLDVVVPRYSFAEEPIGSTSAANSQQEKAIDSAFAKLERRLDFIMNEIVNVNIGIRTLEYQNCDMDFIISKMEQSSREFIHLRYEKLLGYIKISSILHLSPATVGRLRIKVLSCVRSQIS